MVGGAWHMHGPSIAMECFFRKSGHKQEEETRVLME